MSRLLPANSPQRKRRVGDITTRYEAHIAPGFPVTLGGVAETLQVARDVDRTNWLTVARRYDKAVAEGFGDVPGLAFLQTTSNNRYTMTCNEALTIIEALTDWGIAAWDNWNRLKDAARDPAVTPTSEALEALDLEEGWP